MNGPWPQGKTRRSAYLLNSTRWRGFHLSPPFQGRRKKDVAALWRNGVVKLGCSAEKPHRSLTKREATKTRTIFSFVAFSSALAEYGGRCRQHGDLPIATDPNIRRPEVQQRQPSRCGGAAQLCRCRQTPNCGDGTLPMRHSFTPASGLDRSKTPKGCFHDQAFGETPLARNAMERCMKAPRGS